MKHIKILTAFALFLAFTACEKDRAFIEFDDLEKGAFPRLLDGVNGEFNFFDPAGSSIDFTVEFYDENQGKNVQSYAWTASYVDKATNTISNPADVVSFTQSDFKPEPSSGLPSVTVQITFQQVLDALGLTVNDIKGGDAIRMQGTLTKTDGKQFTAVNTSAGILSNGPAFGAWFIFDQNIICPSDLGGTYATTTTGTSTDGCCPDETTVTGEVTLTAEGSGKYTISDWSAGLYLEWYDVYGITTDIDMTAELVDACGIISLPAFGEPFGEQVTGSGSLDAATGVITFTWTSGWGDTAEVVLTPK